MKMRLSDNSEYARRYKGIAYLRFWFKVWRGYMQARKRLRKTLRLKKCYYGPFKGEFGHMTAHTAPFLMYLHKQGVKIIYCGMEIHKPLLVDDQGKSIIHEFRPLRDFFAEVSPKGNSTVPPPDVVDEIRRFEQEALSSGFPFWNIGDDFYYWFIHRNWVPRGHSFVYDLRKAYQTRDENSVCIFPRSKGAKSAKNNGERWDYPQLVAAVSPYFEKVYICGHPSQCEAIEPGGNVELCVSTDNSIMLEKCANSKLIITQHSGVVYLGEYVDTQVLIIYKGDLPIGSIQNTLRFLRSIGKKRNLAFAYTEDEVVRYVKNAIL